MKSVKDKKTDAKLLHKAVNFSREIEEIYRKYDFSIGFNVVNQSVSIEKLNEVSLQELKISILELCKK